MRAVQSWVEESGGKRRYRTKGERRQIVEETWKPGATVAGVARAHDVNVNQVCRWRQLYREGRLDEPSFRRTDQTLVPVRISDAGPEGGPPRAGRGRGGRRPGVIDIDLGHARVRIEGAADADCVRAAVEGLIR